MTVVGGESGLARRAAFRLGFQAALLVALIVAAMTVAAVVVVVGAQRTQAAVVLDDAIAHADDVEDPPAGMHLVLRRPDGRTEVTPGTPAGTADPAALTAAAAGDTPPSVERNVHHVQYEIATARRGDGVTVQAILDLTANHAARNRLLTTSLAIGAVGLVLAAGVGTWLGRRALTPFSAALALQRRFVADAGHELRTPLTLLATRAQLLRRRLHRDPSAEPELLAEADGVVSDSGRLAAIVEDLLLAADPFSERPREDLDLVDVCRDAMDAAAADARDQGIELRLDTTGPLPVTGSYPALLRAVTALVDNAVRHAGSTVVIGGRRDDPAAHQVSVDVRDDGDGVDPVLAPRLFRRFTTGDARADAGSRRRYGLGLALVSEIVTAHGGGVELVAAREPGAAFRITLPTAREVPRNL